MESFKSEKDKEAWEAICLYIDELIVSLDLSKEFVEKVLKVHLDKSAEQAHSTANFRIPDPGIFYEATAAWPFAAVNYYESKANTILDIALAQELELPWDAADKYGKKEIMRAPEIQSEIPDLKNSLTYFLHNAELILSFNFIKSVANKAIVLESVSLHRTSYE